MTYPNPSFEDKQKFFIRLLFGEGDDPEFLQPFIKKAYQDLKRTLRGIAKIENKEIIHKKACETIENDFQELLKRKASQQEFDVWHEETCSKLINIYKEYLRGHNRLEFTHGHAQKWTNMTFKYIYVVHPLSGPYNAFYKFCHVPLDNFMFKQLGGLGLDHPFETWSGIRDYKVYLDFQKKIREKFEHPLNMEFHEWLKYKAQVKPEKNKAQ